MSRTVQAVSRARRPSAALLAGVLAVPALALAAVVLFELSHWDKITPGVTTLGANIGGLTRAEAVSRLTPGVESSLDRPLDIRGSDQTWHTTARALGLRLDPNELVDTAYSVGRRGSPLARLGDQLDVAFHGRNVSVASTTDRAALDSALATMAHQIEKAPVNARLSLAKDGNVQSTRAQDGLAVDVDASRTSLTTTLNTTSGPQVVYLTTHAVPPSIPDSVVQTAHDQLDRLFGPSAEPFTATFGNNTWSLDRNALVKLVSLQGGTSADKPAVVQVDDDALSAWAARLAKDVDQPVQDARFQFRGGTLKVLRPSKIGRTLDQSATVQTVHDALLAGDHTLALPVKTIDPAVSSDNPDALGITELIDKGSTSFAGSIPEKKANIKLAAERLTGVVVAPGATFSFNDAVGPTTLEAGFQWGFGITSGNGGPKTVPSVAGGICQVATTLFQPVFWSGYQLEERYWHLYWIPAYTSRGVVGLDVTVDSDAGLDFKWTNPTRDYVLVQADTDDSNIYFALYGKKPSWKVEVDDAVITNRTPPDKRPIAQEEPTLPWGRTLMVETARDGFDAQVVRRVLPADGGKPRELSLKSTYEPAHTVTLVGTGGKPAGASVQDAIQRVLDGQKPAEAKPTPAAGATPATGETSAPAATPPPPAEPTKPAAPAATPPAQSAAPTPKPASRTAAASGTGIAATPAPSH